MRRHKLSPILRSLVLAWLALVVCGAAQAQVPAAPSGLAATVASAGQINLTWTDNSTNETSFKVERKTGAGAYAQIGTTSANVATYQSAGLLASTTYFFRVRSSNASGNSATYSNEVSATTPAKPAGLVAAYSFNENTGTVLGDVSGGGFNGTLTNSPTWTAGKYASALQFTASDDGNDNNDPRVVLGRTINIPNLPLTISAWVNPTNYNDWRAIISKRDTPTAADMRLDVGLTQTTGLVYVFVGGSPSQFSYAPPVNAWTNLAVVADSSSTRLYANGVLQGTMAAITLGTDTTANTVIGGSGEGTGGDNDPFNGKIDDLRIYSRALTQTEIQTDMNTPVGGTAPPPDTAAPSTPTGLTMMVASSTQINLAWTASTDNVGVSGYQIDRCLGASCSTFTQIATPTTTSFSNTGLTAGTSYSYRVRATDAAGNLSANSSVASATTAADTAAPTVPTALGATVVSSTQINLSWTASTDNVGVSGYQIDRCLGASCTTFAQVGTATTTTFNNTGLTASTSYSYRVRATDAAGNVSANSATASATTPAAPDTAAPSTPTGVSATAASSTQINLTWTASTDNVGVTGYQIDRCQGPSCSTFTQIGTSATTTFNSTGLTASTSYSYRVRATDAAGNASANSVTASATTPAAPDTAAPSIPTGLGATAANSTQINVTWIASTDNVGVSGYQIDSCQGASCSTFTQVGTSTTAAFANTGLTASTSYSYRVRATDAAGNVSANSVTASATTQAPPDTVAPSSPATISAAVPSSTQIDVSWSASTDNVGVSGYQIDRCQGAGCTTFTQIATSSVPSFSNTGLTASTTYRYQVRATDAAGNVSANSSIVTSTTSAPPDTVAPIAPTGVSATAASSTQINLNWTASTDNVAVTGYQIDRCQGPSCSTFAQVGTSSITTLSDTGLAASTSYSYRVRATDAAGNISANSSIVSGTTLAPPDTAAPGIPTGLNATAASGTQINLAWTASTDNVGVTGYQIDRCQGAGCSTFTQIGTSATTAFGNIGLTASTSYTYRVRATDAAGNISANSGTANATTLAPPSAPANLSATGGPNAQTNLRWTDTSDNEIGFKIERKTEPGGTYAQIATTAANVTSYDDLGLSDNGTIYFYRVRATNAVGDSAYSNEAGAATPVPDVVTNQNIVYTYDPFGNLTQTNAGGVVTTMDYDIRGRKTRTVDPDTGTWNYAYNALGELVRQTDAKSQVTRTTYDVLGRTTNSQAPDLVSTWTYDSCTMGKGKLCQTGSNNGYSRTHAYDTLGRPSTTTAVIDTTYTMTINYIAAGANTGKVDTVTYPDNFVVQYTYNTRGYLETVQRPGISPPLWNATAMSASGIVTSETLGSGITQTRIPDELDRMLRIIAGAVQNLGYTYDAAGNVTDRADTANGITEHFDYDKLNRLTMSSGTGPSGALVTRSFDYDAIGNIVYKSDVGTYHYGAKPHAVASISGSVNTFYSYDANGNLTSGAGRTLTPTSFNQPAIIANSAGGVTYTYTYSSEQQRVRLVTQLPTGTQTSIYFHPGAVGTLFYEKEIKPDSSLEHKHYVQAGPQLVGVYVTKSSYASGDGPQMRYYHKDSLGSIVAISNEAGARIEGLGYEAFGKRRSYQDGTADPSGNIFGVTTDRGFTAHEHLDELGLIHMNGRVYDPLLGRFMTPDPFIQSPGDLQSYNRYSYVWNNPLGYTDPTGYSRWTRFRDSVTNHIRASIKAAFVPTLKNEFDMIHSIPGQKNVDHFILTHKWAYMVGQMAATYFTAICGGCGGAAWAAYYTYESTGSVNKGVKAGAIAYVTENAGGWASGLGVPGEFVPLVQATVNGGASVAQGGKFGDGFLGSLAGSYGTEAIWTFMPSMPVTLDLPFVASNAGMTSFSFTFDPSRYLAASIAGGAYSAIRGDDILAGALKGGGTALAADVGAAFKALKAEYNVIKETFPVGGTGMSGQLHLNIAVVTSLDTISVIHTGAWQTTIQNVPFFGSLSVAVGPVTITTNYNRFTGKYINME